MSEKLSDRFKKNWYDKKMYQNEKIGKHLIKIIADNKTDDFPKSWTNSRLNCLPYCDLFEIAVAVVNKNIQILAGVGEDWSGGADGKVTVVRTHNYNKNYSALIKGCSEKKYILALVYEAKQDKFYYFAFAKKIKEHSIPFDLDGNPKRDNYMWDTECNNFASMAMKAHSWFEPK